MSEQHPPWPPRAGDRVTVTATGASGTVATIVGTGEAQRFLVDIQPEALEQELHALGKPLATAPERHSYRLEDLGPSDEGR